MGKVGTLKRLSRVAILVAIGAALVGVPLGASANPDISSFELDGNAASSGASDWNALGSPLDFTGFIPDPTDSSDTGFTTGGSKDTNDVSQWKWTGGAVTPAKDNIANAYAAVYSEQSNLVLYFGQNRVLDNKGDANVGFWFLQDSVGLNSDGSFSGTHKDGDLLVQSGFTNGGDVSGVQVYKWQSGALTLVSNQAECTGNKLGTADACAIVNKGTISTSWAGDITSPYFFEGGLNLSAVYGSQVPCFSTFLTNTRTSQSESAELKDFALGGIDTCGSIKISKQAQPSDGTSFGYTATGGLDPASFQLADGGTQSYSKLSPGSYSVSESAPSGGWTFDSLSCSTVQGPGTSVQINGQIVNITLGFLGNVECKYVNVFPKKNPTVTTDVHNAQHGVITSAPFGSTVHDKAAVSGGFGTPTGTVDFTVYLGSSTCAGQGTSAGSVGLSGGIADPSNDVVVPAGGLSFKGHYSGDGKYLPADGPCEPLTGTTINPSVTTDVHDGQHNVITSAPIGSTVHDKALVSGGAGTPTGSVDFTVWLGSTTCSGQGSAAGTVALNGSGVADPSNNATVPVDGLSFRAHYNGDSVYNPGDGPCESLAATKLTPTVTTDVHNAAHQVITSTSIGSSVHDKALVTGSGPAPTGSVTFTVWLGNTSCDGQGAAAGSAALNGSGIADPSSNATVPAGGLSFKGHYSGDATYTEGDGPCEPLTGDKIDATVTTDVHDGQHNVITSAPIGTTVHDKAAVSGAAGTPTGSVDFTVWLGSTTCSGQGSAAGTVGLNGSGIADPSDNAVVPAGGLSFRGHYSGNSVYNSGDGPCEPLTGGKLTPTVTTDVHDTQHNVITSAPIGTTVHDKAAVSGAAGTPTGSVDFTVWLGSTTCSGQGSAAGNVALNGAGIADPSNNATVPAGGVSFRAHYNGDSIYNSGDGPCESLSATMLTPTVATDVHNAQHIVITSAPIGSIVHDKASVSGAGGTPTGNVSVTVWLGSTTCEGQGAVAGTVALVAGVADPSSTSAVPAGGLSFRGHYNGNATYTEADGPCEPLTGEKLTPQVATDVHNAAHQVITSAPIGSTVHDKASVSGGAGTPTGSVDFTVWLDSTTCSGQGSAAGTVALNGSGVADPSNNATVPVDGLSFRAHYNGDSVYNTGDGPCESLAATKLTPTVTTDVHNAAHQVITSAPIGSTVHDKASVSGAAGTPTGSVSFRVFLGSKACSGEGAAAGTVDLNGSGVADPSNDAVLPAGGLSFRGHYSGDAVYTEADGPCEPLAALFGTIIVEKQTTPNGAAGSFAFTGDAAGSIGDNGQIVVANLAPGTYTSTEAAQEGWSLTGISCNDEGSSGNVATRTATFKLAAGATVKCTFTNAKLGQGSISVSKSADPTSVKEPGGPVTYSVTITNTSADVDVHITNVVDDKFGDLDDDGGSGCFDVPINLKPAEKVSCQFTRTITGVGGTSHINTVTASGTDENGNPVSASDDAKVDITPRLIDLVIVKEATSPTPLNGIVNYSLTVTNRGPDTATNVQLADPAPAGITYLTANPSQGSCNVSPSLITCSLGNIAAGQTVTIAITARATTVGSHTNTATVTGGGGRETNPADNVDTAVTIVPAPLKPPTVKPKPAPEYCLALTVSPKMIKADGKPDRVVIKVTAGSKPVKGVKVSLSGAGVKKSVKTNGKGIAVIRINPRKPGLNTVTVVESNHDLCGPKRIGVVGVFLPPLTG